MLKILLFLCFLIPMCCLENFYWMVQLIFLFIRFIFLLFNNKVNYFRIISYFLGCDILSYGLLLLRFWIISLIIIARRLIFKNRNYDKLFIFNNLFLLIFLFLTFRRINLFLFYFFFERRLIPTLLLILGWGYQPERIQAGLYLLFYTLLVSLPILLGIVFIYNFIKRLNFYIIINYQFFNEFLYYSLLIAFLVKIPIYLVHLWLPKAHVEAPIAGSIILAGVILKLGGYGLLRVLSIFQLIGIKYNLLWIRIRLIGSIIVSLICLRQVDLKSLIAYSSVAHIGLVLIGIITIFYIGFCGSYIIIIGHGLCSSGIFCLININYERLGSRSLFINKGIINFIPSLSLWWFLLLSVNISAPPSLNLLSEILLINRIVCWSWISIIFISLLSFFSASYTLYLYSYSQHGIRYSGLFSFRIASVREYLLLFLHWFPLNLLILKSDLFLLWL